MTDKETRKKKKKIQSRKVSTCTYQSFGRNLYLLNSMIRIYMLGRLGFGVEIVDKVKRESFC